MLYGPEQWELLQLARRPIEPSALHRLIDPRVVRWGHSPEECDRGRVAHGDPAISLGQQHAFRQDVDELLQPVTRAFGLGSRRPLLEQPSALRFRLLDLRYVLSNHDVAGEPTVTREALLDRQRSAKTAAITGKTVQVAHHTPLTPSGFQQLLHSAGGSILLAMQEAKTGVIEKLPLVIAVEPSGSFIPREDLALQSERHDPGTGRPFEIAVQKRRCFRERVRLAFDLLRLPEQLDEDVDFRAQDVRIERLHQIVDRAERIP